MPLDPQQFGDLFLAHRDALAGFLVRLTGDAAQADDLLQETFVSLWRKGPPSAGWERPDAYLRAVGFRLFLSRVRRDRRRRSLAADAAPRPVEATDADAVEGEEERRVLLERVRHATALLPEPLREAFDLYRVRGLRVAEIALLTRTNVKTVETRIRRATLSIAGALRPAPRPELTSHG